MHNNLFQSTAVLSGAIVREMCNLRFDIDRLEQQKLLIDHQILDLKMRIALLSDTQQGPTEEELPDCFRRAI